MLSFSILPQALSEAPREALGSSWQCQAGFLMTLALPGSGEREVLRLSGQLPRPRSGLEISH